MDMRKHARTLVMASLIAVSVAGVPVAQQVHAQPYRPRDSYPLCTYFNQLTGSWEFYGPGDTIYVKDGNGNLHSLSCIQGKWEDGGVVPAAVGSSAGAALPLPALSTRGS